MPESITVLNAVSESRYIGKECMFHPEEKGLRMKASNRCVACQRERRHAYKHSAESLAKEKQRKADARLEAQALKKIDQACERSLRFKAQDLAYRACRNMGPWREYVGEAYDALIPDAKLEEQKTSLLAWCLVYAGVAEKMKADPQFLTRTTAAYVK